MQARATSFLNAYLTEYEQLRLVSTTRMWKAANSGKEEDFKAQAQAFVAMKKFHSDPVKFQEILDVLASGDQLAPLDRRSLKIAKLYFQGNQLPENLLEDMAQRSSKIEQAFSTYRGELGGKTFSNNGLLEKLKKELNSSRRKEIWEALKQVGGAVGPDLVALAKVRNEAARKLDFENYWDMMIRLQEHDPEQLLRAFDELAKLTDEPFRVMKEKLDKELSRKFKIKPEDMRPWHYDNPFFQAAPPSEAINLDEFYRDKKKEDIAEIAIRFFDDIGLPIQDIVKRSDLYERDGKNQHAFCEDMDRKGDVRTLLNIKPTAEWMDTMLHENGHAVYDKHVDRSLPFNVRQANHIFTTEAIAMLFGALGKTPTWIVAYAGGDEKRVNEVAKAVLEQRRREQLIFCRWSLVMLHFEKKLYENPDQDLNTLWWDTVERYQFVKRPEGRDKPDWASKPHFTIAPVYYHNYQLGELFAAQLRATLARIAKHEGPTSSLSFNGRKDFGEFLKEKVFKPGSSVAWPQFVKDVTGEELTARYFAAEL